MRSCAVLLALVVSIGCEPQAHDPGGAVAPAELPAEATVKSLRVFPGERREGLRKVEVTLLVAATEGVAERTVTIVEWVPVVLLRRLSVGASVALTTDPLEEGRLTLAL